MKLTASENATVSLSEKIVRQSRLNTVVVIVGMVVFVAGASCEVWLAHTRAAALHEPILSVLDENHAPAVKLTDAEWSLRMHAINNIHVAAFYLAFAVLTGVMLVPGRRIVRQAALIHKLLARLRELGELEGHDV